MKNNETMYNVLALKKEISEDFLNNQKTRKQMLDDCTIDILERLKKTLTEDDRTSILVPMRRIGAYHSTIGALECFTRPQQGWKHIKQGILYTLFSYKILNIRWQRYEGRIHRGFTNASIIADYAAICLSIMPEYGLWLLDIMNQSLQNKYLNWTGEDYYSIFLVRLYRKLIGEPDIDSRPPNHWEWKQPYQDFFETWNDTTCLAKSIRELCDYHLCWNNGDTEEHRAEFPDYFAKLNPVEIHALEYVRKKLGLTTPTVEHPLLMPPFYPIPDCVKDITTEMILNEDDLLRYVIESNEDWCNDN
jgi:hypothetical protein